MPCDQLIFNGTGIGFSIVESVSLVVCCAAKGFYTATSSRILTMPPFASGESFYVQNNAAVTS
jgi:hypothetical protein